MEKNHWMRLTEAARKYHIPSVTLKSWVKKGILDWKQTIKGKKGSPIYINEMDIPTYLRQ